MKEKKAGYFPAKELILGLYGLQRLVDRPGHTNYYMRIRKSLVTLVFGWGSIYGTSLKNQCLDQMVSERFDPGGAS